MSNEEVANFWRGLWRRRWEEEEGRLNCRLITGRFINASTRGVFPAGPEAFVPGAITRLADPNQISFSGGIPFSKTPFVILVKANYEPSNSGLNSSTYRHNLSTVAVPMSRVSRPATLQLS